MAGENENGFVVVSGRSAGFAQDITIRTHRLRGDEPVADGGTDLGPSPYDYLVTALGTCTSMTVSLYARRKQWPLQSVTVKLRHSKVHAEDCANCETKVGLLDRIEREITLVGQLSEEQKTRLMDIADKCPVHRTLTSEIAIDTRLVP